MSDEAQAALLISRSPGGIESLDAKDRARVKISSDVQLDRADDCSRDFCFTARFQSRKRWRQNRRRKSLNRYFSIGSQVQTIHDPTIQRCNNMTILAIETSCDETSAAIVRDGRILSNVVSSQTELHAEYGGVVPELAAREHLRNLIPVANRHCATPGFQSGTRCRPATQGPGLPNALLVGFKAAQAVAFALNKPFVGINHHEAHLYSPWISNVLPTSCRQNISDCNKMLTATFLRRFLKFQPNISLIVSGGHTMLVLVESELKHRVLGSTIDDAAGECFDKTGKMMGLNYPAGPEIDKLAEQGNPSAFDFPRPLMHDASDDF